MKVFLALCLSLFLLPACLGPGGGSPFSTCVSTDGSGTLAYDGATVVAVVDGKLGGGVFLAGTSVPVIVNGTTLLFDFEGQKVIVNHLVEPKARVEFALLDPVPPEFQAYVVGAVEAGRLADLQAQGILTFE